MKKFIFKSFMLGVLIFSFSSCEELPDSETETDKIVTDELKGLWTGIDMKSEQEVEINFTDGKFSYNQGDLIFYTGSYGTDTSDQIRILTGLVDSSSVDEYKGKTWYSIYAFYEADILVMACNEPGNDYIPANFEADSIQFIYILTRNGKEIPDSLFTDGISDDFFEEDKNDSNLIEEPDTSLFIPVDDTTAITDSIPNDLVFDDRLEGTWYYVNSTNEGDFKCIYEFNENNLTISTEGIEIYGSYWIDESSEPQKMVLTIESEDAIEKAYMIYKFEVDQNMGEIVVMAGYESETQEFPTDFNSEGVILTTLAREYITVNTEDTTQNINPEGVEGSWHGSSSGISIRVNDVPFYDYMTKEMGMTDDQANSLIKELNDEEILGTLDLLDDGSFEFIIDGESVFGIYDNNEKLNLTYDYNNYGGELENVNFEVIEQTESSMKLKYSYATIGDVEEDGQEEKLFYEIYFDLNR